MTLVRAESIVLTLANGQVVTFGDVGWYEIDMSCGIRETTDDWPSDPLFKAPPVARTYERDPSGDNWTLLARGLGNPIWREEARDG